MSLQPIVRGSDGPIELPDSPAWDGHYGQMLKCVRRFGGNYAVLWNAMPIIGGVWIGGVTDGMTVMAVSLRHAKPYDGLMEIEFGGGAQVPLPPDECAVEMVQQEIAVEKHPRYVGLSDDYREAVAAAARSSNPEYVDDWAGTIEEEALAAELYKKITRGETHYVVFLPTYRWTSNYIEEPAATRGNYIETPFGPIESPSGLEWLRCGDSLAWTGTFWRLTRNWQGSSKIDHDLYPPFPS